MKEIHWVKWVDPMMSAVRLHRLMKHEDEEFDLQEARDSFLDDEDVPVDDDGMPLMPIVMGPNGFIPLGDHNVPGKHYNLWMAHLNFDLTPSLVAAVERIPGVETLDVYTRYRMRVGIGKAFSQQEVKQAIERAILEKPRDHVMDRMAKQLSDKHAAWAIHRLPTGKLQVVTGADQEEVAGKSPTEGVRLGCSWERGQ